MLRVLLIIVEENLKRFLDRGIHRSGTREGALPFLAQMLCVLYHKLLGLHLSVTLFHSSTNCAINVHNEKPDKRTVVVQTSNIYKKSNSLKDLTMGYLQL